MRNFSFPGFLLSRASFSSSTGRYNIFMIYCWWVCDFLWSYDDMMEWEKILFLFKIYSSLSHRIKFFCHSHFTSCLFMWHWWFIYKWAFCSFISFKYYLHIRENKWRRTAEDTKRKVIIMEMRALCGGWFKLKRNRDQAVVYIHTYTQLGYWVSHKNMKNKIGIENMRLLHLRRIIIMNGIWFICSVSQKADTYYHMLASCSLVFSCDVQFGFNFY